jgi:hypothetical protein
LWLISRGWFVCSSAFSYLLELLAREGFLVVCVPYNVTFDHEAAAREVFDRFHACYDALLASGLPEAGLTALDVAELPLYSVGHRWFQRAPLAR